MPDFLLLYSVLIMNEKSTNPFPHSVYTELKESVYAITVSSKKSGIIRLPFRIDACTAAKSSPL